MDVEPDIELGPVREREDPHRLAGPNVGVVEVPEFGALAAGVPGLVGGAEREDALFGARLLLFAAGAAEGGVEAVEAERLQEPFGLPDAGVGLAAVVEGVDAGRDRLGVAVDEERELFGGAEGVAEGDHLPELEGGIDVQEREGQRAGSEGLAGQVHQRRRVFADGVEHDRALEAGHRLAKDVDGLGLEGAEEADATVGEFCDGLGHGFRSGGPPLPYSPL